MIEAPPPVIAALQSFAGQLGLEGLSLDDNGYCGLESDCAEALHFQLREDEGGEAYLELSTMLGCLPGTDAQDGFRLLLEANFSGYGSKGGCFALYPGSDEVWYFCRVEAGRPVATMVAHCLDAHEFWREQLTVLSGRTAPDDGEVAGVRV